MSGLSELEQAILREVTPTPEEETAVAAVVRDLEAQADARLRELGLPGKAAVQGSVAKGTWLRGGADLDLFLLLDLTVPAKELESVAKRVGATVLQDGRTKYAQHPYLVGTFRGHAVDLVPAYRVAKASDKMSAVDRTPFHTEWVRSRLTPGQRAEVRLAKRWLKGTGAYGAQTAIGGFSGYLVEVLVAAFGSFAAVLGWLAKDAQPRRVKLGPDAVSDDVSPLVVVDPVDAARNCAAAVQAETLELAAAAAKAYRARPDRRFFVPAPPRAEPPAALAAALAKDKAQWTGLLVRPATNRLDIVFPQFQRAARTIAAGLAETGFPTLRQRVQASPDESEILFQWMTTGGPLPERRLHTGPPADRMPNAAKFREKWEPHPDRAGPIRAGVDGRLEVEVTVRERNPADWLHARLGGLSLGRHVEESLAGKAILRDPAAAPAAWAPSVADLVLGRLPWER